MRLVSVLVLGALFLPAPAPAQQPGSSPGFCFRGRALPRCQWFPLIEFAVSTRLAERNRREETPRFFVSGELGALYNVGARSAVGGGAYLGADDDGWRLGIRPRYRYWLGNGWSLDAAAGVLIAGELDLYEGTWPGLSAQVGLGWQDLIAVTTQLEVIGTTQGTWSNWYVGIQAASLAALVAAPLGWLIVILSVPKD